VKTIPYEDSQGELTETYDMIIKTRGQIPNVQAVSSLKPNIMKTLVAHVDSVMFDESGCPGPSVRWWPPWYRRPTSANIEPSPTHRPSVLRTPNRN
jgi:hypothetical protein